MPASYRVPGLNSDSILSSGSVATRIPYSQGAMHALTGGSCVIGNFDGVHRGHQALLNELRDAPSPHFILTFYPHPRLAFSQLGQSSARKDIPRDSKPFYLNDRKVQACLMGRYGIDYIVEINFTPELIALSPIEFIDTYLRPLDLSHIVVGENFRFGKNRSGNVDTLVHTLPAKCTVTGLSMRYGDNGDVISSTHLRDLLARGHIPEYTKLAGHPPMWISKVRPGDGLGRTLEMPTLNLVPQSHLIYPTAGIYIAAVAPVEATLKPALLYIGHRPSVAMGGPFRLEAHVLESSVDWTDQDLQVAIYDCIRKDKKFNSMADLMNAMRQDYEQAMLWWGLKGHNPA